MDRKILINVADTDLRVAFLEEGRLVGLQVEAYEEKSIVGNLYKGRVEGVVPGLKAVFVNIGFERNAFLHFSDVHNGYTLPSQGRPTRRQEDKKPSAEHTSSGPLTVAPEPEVDKKQPATRKGSVPLEVGDTILVQAIKDEIGDKGPRITTNLSLPGRFLVYLPFSENEGGVSRRIENVEERRRLKKILQGTGSGTGSFIVRTAGLEQDEDLIKSDTDRLRRQWKSIERKAARASAPALIHNDHDILFRLVRDSFQTEESLVIIDEPVQQKKLQRAIKELMPESKVEVQTFDKPGGMFEAYDVDRQIQKALKNKVWMKSGGYLIIEETEAMTAIDVNTGKFVGHGDQEETILRTNLEAAAEVVGQLRVRDIGGLIVVDFIDMMKRANQEKLIKEFAALMKQDRAKTSFTGISEFGLIEITRQRVRQSLLKTMTSPCPYCEGSGRIPGKAQIWRNVRAEIVKQVETHKDVDGVEATVHPELRKYLEQELLESIRALANQHRVTMTFVSSEDRHITHFQVRIHEKKAKTELPPAPRKRVRSTRSRQKPAAEKTAPATPAQP